MPLDAGPDVIFVGPSVRLVSIAAVAKMFHLGGEEAARFLESLGVPLVNIRRDDKVTKMRYFNLPTLERILYVLTRPGEESWDGGVLTPARQEEVKVSLRDPKITGEFEDVVRYYRLGEEQEIIRKARDFSRAVKAATKRFVRHNR